jgi:WD40 repeat protein
MECDVSDGRVTLREARRAARTRKVVEEVMTRRASGQAVPDAAVLAQHAELMPELARELSLLSMLERARETGLSRTGAPRRDRPIEPLGEDAFEGYSIVREAHRGGQGVVYEAVQKSTGRRVAIKVMREGLFAGDRDAARFEREVRILGQLEHPGVVSILASGVRAGHFFYVMDYVQGQPLDDYAASLRAGDAGVRSLLGVFDLVCEAVNAAHLRGIIHRDLKPGNILVDAQGMPRILDFGLARVAAEDHGLRLTATGQFVGSMPWSSPEQAAGDQSRVDLRTDVYSLGVIFYQALAGRFPYAVEGGPRDVLNNILTAAPARLRAPNGWRIDADVEAIILKCLSKERERRYQSAGELASDLRRFLADRPVLARPPTTVYQLRAFARRNKLLVGAGLAIASAIVLGLIGLTAGLIEASIARRAAVRDRDAARLAQAAADSRRAEAERHAYNASIAAADSALRAEDAAGAVGHLTAAPAHLRDWEWRYLSARTDQSAAVLEEPPVEHAMVSADGRWLGLLLRDQTVRVVDAATGAVRWQATVPAPLRDATDESVAYLSPDGSTLVTGHAGHVVVWRVGAQAPVNELEFPSATWGFISAAISPDGRTLVANGREGRMMAWELPGGRLVREFPDAYKYVGVDFSPDGSLVAAATANGLELFDGRTLASIPVPVTELTNSPGGQGGVRFSPDGSRVVATRGVDLIVLSIPKLEVVGVLHGHTQRVDSWSFSPDGSRLVSAGWDRTVRVWDLAKGRQERLFWGHSDRSFGAGFLSDGHRVASASADGTVRLWDLALSGEPSMLAFGTPIFGLNFFPDGQRLLVTGFEQLHIRNIDPRSEGSLAPTAIGLPGPDARAGISADGALLAAPTEDGRVRVWDVQTASIRWTSDPHGGRPVHLHFSPDGRFLVTESEFGDTRAWATIDGALLWSSQTPHDGNTDLAVSPDSSLIAVGMERGVRLLDATTGGIVADFCQPRWTGDRGSRCYCVAVSPDGSLLAGGDNVGRVLLWDIRSRTLLRTLSGMNPAVWSIAFNPSGSRLATGSQDRTARIWDPRSGDELLVLRGHTGTVISLAWSPDGGTLASGSYDGSVRLWSAGPPPR